MTMSDDLYKRRGREGSGRIGDDARDSFLSKKTHEKAK